ncbi:hypothetical protein [Acinetobacter rudis]|uniref:Lipoprotein n=1 Tax=Acinetobacter rudis CIP 110305 TaxID=421052 RepID=S3NU38_9GAMM|nr:hypothetical protein [Acinetobacter rudis]EPF70171.1 hypothetical protein F945_03188 [Acinetobacter rudis CIP 110305]
MKKILCALVISIGLVGCTGPRIATDLLTARTVKHNPALIPNAANIAVTINPQITNKFERIDNKLKESLEVALKDSNIFGNDQTKPYKIDADIMVASQAAMSFGNFNGKLKIHYVVKDTENKIILDETFDTVAGSDAWHFSGAQRATRARAVNISKNVNLFLDALEIALKKDQAQ